MARLHAPLVSLLVSLALTVSAAHADAQVEASAPPVNLDVSAEPVPTEPHPWLHIPGAIAVFAPWVLGAAFGSFIAAEEDDLPALGWLLVPVVGPFVQLSREDHDEDRAFVGVLGALQIVGFTLCILSNVVRREVPAARPSVAFHGTALSVTF
jgi:hypothetical protein